MLKEKKRYRFLDLIKMIAIYLVCFYHCAKLNYNITADGDAGLYLNYFTKVITSTCVPLFFMVNGALLLNKDYDLQKHIKKTAKLIVRIFIWAILLLTAYLLINGERIGIVQFIKEIVTWEKGSLRMLWFLQALTGIYVVFPIIKSIYSNQKILKYGLCMAVFFTFGLNFIDMVLNVIQIGIVGELVYDGLASALLGRFHLLNSYGYAIVYFILGGLLLKKINDKSLNVSGKKLIIASVLSAFIMFGYGVLLSGKTGYLFDVSWKGYDTVMTLIISGSIFIILAKSEHRIGDNRILTMISDNTLGIYLVHYTIDMITGRWFEKLVISSNIIANSIYILLLLAVSLGAVCLLKKVFIIKELFKMN